MQPSYSIVWFDPFTGIAVDFLITGRHNKQAPKEGMLQRRI